MLKRSITRIGSALVLSFIIFLAPAVKEIYHNKSDRTVCAEGKKIMPGTGKMLNRLGRFSGNIFSAVLGE
jgi:hypothetical protein